MAMITELNCNLREAVHVKYLDGNLFSQDVYGNALRVIVMDGDEPATLAGTVSGTAIREDGSTVALTDSRIDENVATVVLPAAAYAVPGVLAITIKISDTNTVTTLAYVVANVYRTSTDTVVDPGTIIPSITTLIEQIAQAVASIPADYSSLWAALAETFNASKSGGYAVGEYVTYDGGLYRFKNAHTGSWSSSDVDAVNLGSGIAKNASDISDLKSALNADILNLNELLKFGTAMNFNFTEGCAINSSGAIFDNTSNAKKRMSTVDFIDISPARATNSIPIDDNGYKEKLTYSIESGYRVYVAYYETPSEESANKSILGWISGSGTLTPPYNYMRICMQSSSDATKVTKADAVNLTMSLYPTIESIVDKVAHWGLIHRGYADTTSFDNVIDVGMYIIANSSHAATTNNPIVGYDGTLIVVSATNTASNNPKLITGLIQIAMSNNGQEIYFRRVSGASTKTFGNWYRPLRKDFEDIKTKAETASGFTEDNFEQGGISETGGSVTNNNRIRTKGYVGTDINNCIRYSIESGYRACFVFFTNNTSSSNIADSFTGWLTGDGAVYCPEGTKYYRMALASIGDATPLTTSDYDVIAIKYDYPLNSVFPPVITRTKWLAIGDSITYGVYSTAPGTEVAGKNGWVKRLANAFGYSLLIRASRGIGYVADGIDPDAIPEPGENPPRIVLDDLLTRIEALTDDFNLITMMLGINDYNTASATLEDIQAGLDDAIERLATKFPNARLVVITPLNALKTINDVTYSAYKKDFRGRTLKDIADLIKSRCEYYGVECIYASNGFLLNDINIYTLLPDKVHPSNEAHTLIAKNMAHYLLN